MLNKPFISINIPESTSQSLNMRSNIPQIIHTIQAIITPAIIAPQINSFLVQSFADIYYKIKVRKNIH